MKGRSDEQFVWYFAYGSNMDSKRLECRIGRKNLEWEVGCLRDYRLTFDKPAEDGSGYANIQPCQGEIVYGVLYRLTRKELEKLDKYEGVYEGVPNHYYRGTVKVKTRDGSIVEAETYFASKPVQGLKPRLDYLQHLVCGAEEHGLPDEYVGKLKKTSTFEDRGHCCANNYSKRAEGLQTEQGE
jgi:cation transport regulator ChaC